ncbi:MAG: hypothetical protein GXP50_00920 [Deltaproteobacteria bacterium]|nr:hypothetical protein [Deltaproteobacteria bacterium]
MERWTRTAQGVAAGLGFFAGFLWALEQWAAGVASVFAAGVTPGVVLAAGYGAGVGWLWRPAWTATSGGLRVVIAPVGFGGSFALGAAMTMGLLRWVGGG